MEMNAPLYRFHSHIEISEIGNVGNAIKEIQNNIAALEREFRELKEKLENENSH